MNRGKIIFFCLALAALALLPVVGSAEVVVLDLTPTSPNPEVEFFAEAMRSWFSYSKTELGGDSQVYVLLVVGKKSQVEIYLDGDSEPRWVVSRRDFTHHVFPSALVFPVTLCGHATAEKIHKYLLRLEKERKNF